MSAHTVAPRSRVWLGQAFLTLVTIVLMLPVLWLLITSLKSESEYVTNTLQIWPERPLWSNFADALTMIDFGHFARNSAVLSFVFAVLTVTTSCMAGYAFARIPAHGRTRWFAIVVGLLLVPTSIYIIPQFVIFARLQLVNTYWPWVLLGMGASPFHIFLFRQFFTAFPVELEEAAEIDGARVYRIFVQLILPNSLPVLATSFILNFLTVWGDWFLPVLYLSNENTTLAVKLIGAYVNPQGYPIVTTTLAASVLYTLPPIAMFFFVQKYIMQGVVTTGLKG